MILSTSVSRPAKVNSLPDIQRTPLPRFHRFQISNKFLHNHQRHVMSSDGIQHYHGNNDMESPNRSCYQTNHKPISEFYFVLIKKNECLLFFFCKMRMNVRCMENIDTTPRAEILIEKQKWERITRKHIPTSRIQTV